MDSDSWVYETDDHSNQSQEVVVTVFQQPKRKRNWMKYLFVGCGVSAVLASLEFIFNGTPLLNNNFSISDSFQSLANNKKFHFSPLNGQSNPTSSSQSNDNIKSVITTHIKHQPYEEIVTSSTITPTVAPEEIVCRSRQVLVARIEIRGMETCATCFDGLVFHLSKLKKVWKIQRGNKNTIVIYYKNRSFIQDAHENKEDRRTLNTILHIDPSYDPKVLSIRFEPFQECFPASEIRAEVLKMKEITESRRQKALEEIKNQLIEKVRMQQQMVDSQEIGLSGLNDQVENTDENKNNLDEDVDDDDDDESDKEENATISGRIKDNSSLEAKLRVVEETDANKNSDKFDTVSEEESDDDNDNEISRNLPQYNTSVNVYGSLTTSSSAEINTNEP